MDDVRDNVSDETLMQAYLANDQRAFEQLFGRIAPRLHAFFRRCFGQATVADELLQTTFLNIHKGRHTYKPGASVQTWMFAIAANVRRDEWRRRYRLKEDCSEDALEAAERKNQVSPTLAAETRDRIQRVRVALERLPESQRVVVSLHRYEGMSFAEIAEVLGTTPAAARIRAFRAYEALREELRDLGRAEAA